MAEIRLEQVSRVFPGGVTAVSGLDLEVEGGELLVLVGPNGCGKTTTLRLIAGLDAPDRGKIFLDGREVQEVSPRGRNIALLFQEAALYPHLTVRDNLAFAERLRNGSGRRLWSWRSRTDGGAKSVEEEREQLERRLFEAAELAGVSDFLARRPGELSGGERQRVALAKALVARPQALLLDEPLTNLDAAWRMEFRRILLASRRTHPLTTLFVTHDQGEALSLGDRVAVMEQGKIVQIGRPAAVYERPRTAFVAKFLGDPPMNLAAGRLSETETNMELQWRAERWRLPPRIASLLKDQTGRRIVWGVRPERLRLNSPQNGEPGFAAQVEDVAYRGREEVATVSPGGVDREGERDREWKVVQPAGSAPRPGSTTQVTWSWDQAVWFNAETGLGLKLLTDG